MSKDTTVGTVRSPTKILYCLDFDGVLCDSVHETFLSGFKACKLLWNKRCPEAWIDDLEKESQKMKRLEDDFRYVRPILYVGWEAILLIRFLAVGYQTEIAGTSLDVKNSTSARDAVFRGFHNNNSGVDETNDFRDHALEAWGFSVEDYGAAMSEARNTWIQEDEAAWIDAHGFYEGACEAVRNYLAERGNSDVYVITTKAKEFALRLLEKQDLFDKSSSAKENVERATVPSQKKQQHYFQESHVFGLGSGPKARVLQEILENRKAAAAGATDECLAAIMVEDNVATLDKISKSQVGNRVLPVVVSWGYNSIEQLADVLLTKALGSTNNLPRPAYVVLPQPEENKSPISTSDYSALANARQTAGRGKKEDPTGASLATVLRPSFDAAGILSG